MSRLLIIGAGGHGRVVADCAGLSGKWSEIAFLDSRHPELSASGLWRVIGKDSITERLKSEWKDVVVAVGDNSIRRHWLAELDANDFNLPLLVHPAASVSSNVNIGRGSVVFAQAAIGTGSRIGNGCIVNTGAILDHDCEIEACVHIAPGARLAGGVKVQSDVWVGIGATITEYIRIGSGAVIGAGSVVIRDIPESTTVIGVPAKPIRNR